MNVFDFDYYILDYDGTLIDSMPIWYGFATKYLEYMGIKAKPGLDDRIKYLSNYDTAKILNYEYNLNMTDREVLDSINKFVLTVYPSIPLKEGALEFLNELKRRNKKIYLLSATPKSLLLMSMKALGIRDYFIDIYSSSDLRLSKETGSAFTYVIDAIKANRTNVLIVEDSTLALVACKKLNYNILMMKDFSNKDKEEFILSKTKDYYTLNEILEKENL
ncbi:MAG: HAD family phosphatase [Acholeplasmatales bacterium]|nr:HAD family phosphatase [Acholeplasmatales bacterium]